MKCALCNQEVKVIPKNRKYQNYYFGCVLPLIMKETGEDDIYRLHSVMKSMFLKRMIEVKGNFYEAVGSTQRMDVLQHNEFVDKVIKWAGEELNLEIPPPDPAPTR